MVGKDGISDLESERNAYIMAEMCVQFQIIESVSEYVRGAIDIKLSPQALVRCCLEIPAVINQSGLDFQSAAPFCLGLLDYAELLVVMVERGRSVITVFLLVDVFHPEIPVAQTSCPLKMFCYIALKISKNAYDVTVGVVVGDFLERINAHSAEKCRICCRNRSVRNL